MQNITIDLNLDCDEVQVTNGGSRTVTVSLEKVQKSDVLDNFDLDDITWHFDEDKILDHIGLDAVKKYFDLTENE